MHINGTQSEACNSPDCLLVLFQCHIRTACCSVLNTQVDLAGGPAHKLGFTFLIHKFILKTTNSFLGFESTYLLHGAESLIS
jgi:hypothetical protein